MTSRAAVILDGDLSIPPDISTLGRFRQCAPPSSAVTAACGRRLRSAAGGYQLEVRDA